MFFRRGTNIWKIQLVLTSFTNAQKLDRQMTTQQSTTKDFKAVWKLNSWLVYKLRLMNNSNHNMTRLFHLTIKTYMKEGIYHNLILQLSKGFVKQSICNVWFDGVPIDLCNQEIWHIYLFICRLLPVNREDFTLIQIILNYS